MTADDPDYPHFLIDGPSPFAPIEELLPWRRECMAMLVEYPDHPWFIGVQYHPELKSRPFEPHPLFASFIAAAIDQSRLV